ncbi:hypothetical protein B0H14DRAFT_3488207 [Mycena olivaceomarginata]|nr:hypothetical protein B0H14DRAFT_3488207 [Mycena olivaceomarginata]
MRRGLGRESMGTDMGRDIGMAGTHTRKDSGAGYGSTSAAASAVARTSTSGSKPYAVVERGGGWDVVHEPEYGGGRGGRRDESTGRDARDAEEEEDVDVVGDADGDTMRRKRDRIGRHERDREVQQTQSVEESVCPPKMRKRWKDASGAAVPVSRAQAPPPPRVDKGKGKVVLRDSAMDVDAGEPPPLPPRLPPVPPPPPPTHFQFQPPLLPQLPPGPSPGQHPCVAEYYEQTVQAAFAFQAADHCFCYLHYEQQQLLHPHDEGSVDHNSPNVIKVVADKDELIVDFATTPVDDSGPTKVFVTNVPVKFSKKDVEALMGVPDAHHQREDKTHTLVNTSLLS